MGEHFSIVLPNATCNGDGCRYSEGGWGGGKSTTRVDSPASYVMCDFLTWV